MSGWFMGWFSKLDRDDVDDGIAEVICDELVSNFDNLSSSKMVLSKFIDEIVGMMVD